MTKGEPLDVVKQILDLIAEFDAILSSGHLHVYEIWKLFTEAKKRGVKRLLMNHPMYGLHFTYDDIKELAEFGALVEQSACLYVEFALQRLLGTGIEGTYPGGGRRALVDRLRSRPGGQPDAC